MPRASCITVQLSPDHCPNLPLWSSLGGGNKKNKSEKKGGGGPDDDGDDGDDEKEWDEEDEDGEDQGAEPPPLEDSADEAEKVPGGDSNRQIRRICFIWLCHTPYS